MDLPTLKRRAIKGVFSLTLRRVILLGINFATINLILARFLPVETIGVFNIANSVLAFFTFFSDIGLAAALIQKKEITDEDLKTTFTIQEILVLILTLAIWFAAPFFAASYKLDIHGMWLIRALSMGFLLTSFKVIPSVLLERQLKFELLVWVEVLEASVFNGLLIYLVFQFFGVDSFSYSTIARSIVGVIVLYAVSPWKVGLGIYKNSAKLLLSFGVPFQLNSLLALLKDRLVPLVIAGMVGPVGVGFITWAQGLAFLPLEVMNIIIRVTFPAYSRLQHDREALKIAIEKSLFFTALFLYPLLFGLLALAPSVVTHIVSNKWQPALPLIYLFGFNAFWSTLSSPFTNAFNAIGKIGITLKLMVMWTVLTWVLSPILTYVYGFVGVAIASAVIGLTSIIPLIIVKKMLNVEVFSNIWQPLVSSALMSIFVFILSKVFLTNYLTFFITVAAGGIIYSFSLFITANSKLKKELEGIKNAFVG